MKRACGFFFSFVMMQAAKEFESELKTEPEDSVADSSPVAVSNKAEEKTEASSFLKLQGQCINMTRLRLCFSCRNNRFMT